MPPTVLVSVPAGRELPTGLLERAVQAVFDADGIDEGEVSLTFLADDPMRAMNARWRGHDWITDVLSFCLHDPGGPPIGDIYVGLEQASRQAEEQGVSEVEELVRLVVHGTLHVLGYEHPEDAIGRARSELFRRQEAIVSRLLAEQARSPVSGAAGTGGSERGK